VRVTDELLYLDDLRPFAKILDDEDGTPDAECLAEARNILPALIALLAALGAGDPTDRALEQFLRNAKSTDAPSTTERIMEELKNGPRTTVDLEGAVGISTKEAAARLSQLRQAGMIRPVGRVVYPDRRRELGSYQAVVGVRR
jgi:predicted Rossmann fold nucleotide-binding protein DprA/Smf involved in DNA uptake